MSRVGSSATALRAARTKATTVALQARRATERFRRISPPLAGGLRWGESAPVRRLGLPQRARRVPATANGTRATCFHITTLTRAAKGGVPGLGEFRAILTTWVRLLRGIRKPRDSP